jgi:2-oxo-4-hydroxy-4-carboxy-5-ureidoimidazoline decarboxylase
MSLEELNTLPRKQAEARFRDCCAADPWVQGMLDNRPFASRDAMIAQSRRVWPSLTENDWLQAFEAHPKIGNVDSLRRKYTSTKGLASGEQAGVRHAPEAVLQCLKTGNDAYQEKFGFIFIVYATGKSAEEMLELLASRLPNTREQEIDNAAREQAQITEIRLEKLA